MLLRVFDGDEFVSMESCSWCKSPNPMDREFCINCGHQAHKVRAECRCPLCIGLKQFYEATGPRCGSARPGRR